MSGVMNGALPPPWLAPGDAGKLLEEIIYERVLSCIDVDALLHFECEISSAFDECGFDDDANVPDFAKDMIDRALLRVRAERWQVHLRSGHTFPSEPWDCEDREEAPAARDVPGATELPDRTSAPVELKRSSRKERSS